MSRVREPWARLRPVGEWLLAGLLAAALLPAGVDATRHGGVGPAAEWFVVGALLVLHAAAFPPAVRRPLAGFGLASAAMLALVAGPTLTTVGDGAPASSYPPVLLPSALVWFLLLYVVSARTRAPWPGRALAVGAAGCVLTVARLWNVGYAGPGGAWAWRLLLATGVVAGTVGAWALGRYRATRREWLAATAERAVAAERQRIAREMHDVVAHSLAVVIAHAEGGRLLAASNPGRAPEVLDQIAASGRRALDEMRDLVGVLRDPSPSSGDAGEPAGPTPPQPTLDDLPDLLDRVRAAGLPVELVERGGRAPLGGTRELTAYRVVQESLTNVVRHAGAGSRAVVELDWSDGVVVTVTDTGGHEARGGAGSSDGRGLAGLRERTEAVGGSFRAGPTATGWRTCARIPA